MTTIAWDGNELAADRKSHIGGVPSGGVTKVHRVIAPNRRVALVGFSGSMAYGNAYLHWLAGGEQPEQQKFAEAKWAILMIDDRRTVYYRCDRCNVWDCLGRMPWAMGSGGDIARGAMAHGASATEAVRVASRLDIETGFGVNVVRF